MSIGQRLRTAINSGHLNLTEFSIKSEIPYTTLSQYLADDRKPGTDALIKIFSTSFININWLLTGQGQMYFSSNEQINDDSDLVPLFPGHQPLTVDLTNKSLDTALSNIQALEKNIDKLTLFFEST